MAQIGLGIQCPKCGKELTIEGGLVPSLTRETIRSRAAQGEVVPITCSNCGTETEIGPSDSGKRQSDRPSSPAAVSPEERDRRSRKPAGTRKPAETRPRAVRAEPWRIILVEDHPIVRNSLVSLLSVEPDLQVCASCDTASEAIRLVEQHRPDLVLVDIALKEGNGLGLCWQMGRDYPGLPMLVLSAYDETLYAERALRAGARGFVGKGAAPEIILDAIRSVLDGKVWLSERVREQASAAPDAGPKRPGIAQLSDRELEVFELMGHGLTVNEIAERLNLSPKTIETHRAGVKEKLGVETSSELSYTAIEWVLGSR